MLIPKFSKELQTELVKLDFVKLFDYREEIMFTRNDILEFVPKIQKHKWFTK